MAPALLDTSSGIAQTQAPLVNADGLFTALCGAIPELTLVLAVEHYTAPTIENIQFELAR